MPKRSSRQKDTQQLARNVLDQIVPDAESNQTERQLGVFNMTNKTKARRDIRRSNGGLKKIMKTIEPYLPKKTIKQESDVSRWRISGVYNVPQDDETSVE